MAAQKACRQCKAIVEGNKCELCGSDDLVDAFKGRIAVLNPETSEIAQHVKINKKGVYAIKLG